MCTYANEPNAHFCMVCETKRPVEEKKIDILDQEDSDLLAGNGKP